MLENVPHKCHNLNLTTEAQKITMETAPLKTERDMSHKVCRFAPQAADVLI